ncbi:MAG: PPC domain-containing DNA-binding protein [Bacillota bacterium]
MQREYTQGRVLLGALPNGEDLLEVITRAAKDAGIKTGTFQLFGACYNSVVACYSPEQDRYLETKVDVFTEITAGLGTISIKDGEMHLHCHLTLVDEQGKVYGGHLMPGSRLFAGEYQITELIGEPMVRQLDPKTGLYLWK